MGLSPPPFDPGKCKLACRDGGPRPTLRLFRKDTLTPLLDGFVMKYPPINPSQTERFVGREGRDGLTCLNKIREIAFNVTGILENSETITYSNEHGYIVRYDVIQDVEYNGVNYTANAKVVITTVDCSEIEMQYNPIFEFPNS